MNIISLADFMNKAWQKIRVLPVRLSSIYGHFEKKHFIETLTKGKKAGVLLVRT